MPLQKTLREVYAEASKAAELEYRTAQMYARALAEYDRLGGPLVTP